MLGLAVISAVGAFALAGCGGSGGAEVDGSSPAATTSSASAGEEIKVAALGDSITAGSPLWDPSPAIREQFGELVDPESQYEFWAAEADERLSFRNCGVFGERTDQIRERLETCSEGADALIVQGGINDIARDRPVGAAARDLRAMVREGLDAGLEVAIAEVLPWNNGYPEAAEPINRLNREIGRIGKEEGVPVLPFYETLEDPDNPGRMKPEWTIDGDHPSIEGYKRLGELAFELPG